MKIQEKQYIVKESFLIAMIIGDDRIWNATTDGGRKLIEKNARKSLQKFIKMKKIKEVKI